MPGMQSVQQPLTGQSNLDQQRARPIAGVIRNLSAGPSEIRGLRSIESQDPSLQSAMKFLQERGIAPWSFGRTREVRIGSPTHLSGDAARGSMGWRVGGTDIINVNKDHPFYAMANQNKDVVPLLASILYHENEHIHGADEMEAIRRQARFLSSIKENPLAQKAARIFSQLKEQDLVGTR